MKPMTASNLYFRQLLAGRDFAQASPAAAQMVNFCYLIGDTASRECVVVDPAWDVRGLVDAAGRDGMKITGALATHYHPDHVGGDLFGLRIEGAAALQEITAVPVHCNRHEADGIRFVTGLSASDLVLHDGGDVVRVGEVEITLVHTPGHTPGSHCFLVDGRLVSGDTLFVQGCGRVDLPGGDPEEMYRTLTQRLAKLPGDVVLYPGHHYGPTETSTLADERVSNYAFRPRDLGEWLAMMG
jgi:glyoxylase-like metal-dependent hydrolase (beta-lactamase superfamily II)